MTLRRSEYSNQNGIKATIYELSHCLYCSGTSSSLGTNIPFSKPSPFSDRAWRLAPTFRSYNAPACATGKWVPQFKASVQMHLFVNPLASMVTPVKSGEEHQTGYW